jgi:hypothetical protein
MNLVDLSQALVKRNEFFGDLYGTDNLENSVRDRMQLTYHPGGNLPWLPMLEMLKSVHDYMDDDTEDSVNDINSEIDGRFDIIKNDFFYLLVKKRIDVYELPIRLTPEAYMCMGVLSQGNPGKLMVMLIECMNFYDEQRRKEYIRAEDIVRLYPASFYDEQTFIDIVDNHMKLRPERIKYNVY